MSQALVVSFVWYFCFLISTVVHEASHSFVALLGGDRTAYEGGQVSLDPWPHIRREPFGMVILPILAVFYMGWPIGYASAPYRLDWAHRYPKRAALMALAGPMANFLLALFAFALLKWGLSAGWWQYPSRSLRLDRLVAGHGLLGNFGIFCSVFLSLNLLLGVFNLLPVPPLDGSTALGLFLPTRMARKYHDFLQIPGLAMIGLFVAWNFFHNIWNAVVWPVILLLYTL
ncbi:MAG: site-2 protease family protein [Oligoflexales bacterium]